MVLHIAMIQINVKQISREGQMNIEVMANDANSDARNVEVGIQLNTVVPLVWRYPVKS